MKKILALVLLATCCGCHTLIIELPSGEKVTSRRFGNKVVIDELTATKGTNGITTFRLKGYVNDQVEFAERVTKAAVEAAAKSMTP